jgi:uncharacterized protein (DUF362 family)
LYTVCIQQEDVRDVPAGSLIAMSIVSLAIDSSLQYPPDGDFSPHQTFPENPFAEVGTTPNGVYALVRQCLHQAGADAAHFDTAQWNPLGDWIEPGQRVFVLPNFVAHQRPEQSRDDFLAKCTHASVLRPLLDYIYLANRDWSRIGFGNAPIQSCDYARLAQELGTTALVDFYQKQTGARLGPHDLRGVITKWTRYGALLERHDTDEEQVEVDLGADSWLDELFQKDSRVAVRVGDYDPRETDSYHARGRHVYVLNRRVLEADVLISAPTLKTHQKVGITCAIKGTVGAIAKKECLAHHRPGGPGHGGDEFAQSTLMHRFASQLTDKAAAAGNDIFSNGMRVAGKVLYRALRQGSSGIVGGAWYGNDTAWRMALDIARILRFARVDGTLAATPQRRHLALVDGIMAGEDEGPLTPKARPLGAVLFSPDICAADEACARLMGFDPQHLAIVRHAWEQMRYPLTEEKAEDTQYKVNGAPLSGEELLKYLPTPFVPPKGWVGKMERANYAASSR